MKISIQPMINYFPVKPRIMPLALTKQDIDSVKSNSDPDKFASERESSKGSLPELFSAWKANRCILGTARLH